MPWRGPTVSSPLALAARLQSSVRALPSSGVSVGFAPPPGGTLAGVKLKVAPVVDPCRPKIDHVPIANMEHDDPVHPAPSATDRGACGCNRVQTLGFQDVC